MAKARPQNLPRAHRAPGGRSARQTAKCKAAFLVNYAEMGLITPAAEAAGISRRQVFNWRKDDEEFSKAFDEAEEAALDVLLQEARRRAKEGYDEYVVSAGKLITMPDGTPRLQKRFSDGLMKLLIEMKTGKPVQRLEHSGSIEGKPKELAPEYLARVLAELNSRGALETGAAADVEVHPVVPD